MDASVQAGQPDFGEVFHACYPRISRVIARMVQDPGRAEELSAEVFWKFWRTSRAHGGNSSGWLYRTAVRMGLDELRRQRRRERYEKLSSFLVTAPSPEQLHSGDRDRGQVRQILSVMKARYAELLVLRSEGLTYQETAEILQIHETSIGTLLRRAQEAFRKEYVKRYGLPNT